MRLVIVGDLRSRHGTFANEEPANQSTAQVGARLRFGKVLCLLAPVAMYPAPTPGSCDGLTPAQHEVLHLVLQGLRAVIAERLGRSWHTVHTHVKAIFKRFEVHNRTELLAKLLAEKESAPTLIRVWQCISTAGESRLVPGTFGTAGD
jgi:DNA-binding CsgD family transcriptional regulator